MYEQISHAILNDILDDLGSDLNREDLRHFFVRLGANFYAIHSLFSHLYGDRDDVADQLRSLVERLARAYVRRPDELRRIDMDREEDHNWFLNQNIVAMALYCEGFAGDLKGLESRLEYLAELGINMVHVLPILTGPEGARDGGYAVSDFRRIDPRVGTAEDLSRLARTMRERGMLLALDVVVNHTSDQHEWARRARVGDEEFENFYFLFDDRRVPDAFERTMPEIFPENAPGNFTFDEASGKWAMTVFNTYQWDLNYTNPRVLIEMVDVILHWANHGADVIRLDAVAFLWKQLGTSCQNLREAHLILQLMKDCCQVVAPGVLFIAEAIVAPVEIARYFGEDAVIAKECEIAYNATLMALLWDGVATGNAKLLSRGVFSLPNKLDRATWLNYVRCHDDIGLGFDDADIAAAGYDPTAHRRFLLDWFTGRFEGSVSRGELFAVNTCTGDARISGSLASLAGLEAALDSGDSEAVDLAVDRIVMLHAMIMSYGGIPMLYYGDEVATLNNWDYRDDPARADDSRWLHRPVVDWLRMERRFERGTVEQRVFSALKRLIEIRKTIPAFADFNNRELIDIDDPSLFAFLRTPPDLSGEPVLVVANFGLAPATLVPHELGGRGIFRYGTVVDLHTGDVIELDREP
ncbi:MAG: alpha-amylase family glycosyl hydrolase, partial [Thermoanaerobaculales bacterium]|nr:alpha-amylase family glycosyl hydrolase [Thermoanaerobaculales bacterium]